MKEFLVDYVGSTGLVFETFATKEELNAYKEQGTLVCFRKLTHGEFMEIASYGF